MDEDYLNAMSYGMPRRVVLEWASTPGMLLTDQRTS
jgi:hypothetical protein